jgi:small subunit ribosomal protein S19e
MTTAYDIPAEELIKEVAKQLRSDNSIALPKENMFTKTGVHRENTPENKDWWYTRCASILRKIYIKDGIGVERLRAEYGGKRDRGSKPNKARAGSGSIVRRALQQLEKAGYVKKVKGKGRVLTSKGRSFLDNISNNAMKNIDTIDQSVKKN